MKAVLDTNAWLDWLVFDDPSARPLGLAAEAGSVTLLACAATRAEWLAVIARGRFGLDPSTQAAIALRYDRHVTLLADAEPSTLATPALVCRDPDDQKFLELAVASGADFLVTRDKALLRLARQAQQRHGLAIVGPLASAWREALGRLLAGNAPGCVAAGTGTERL